jgi:hypothetical protein
MSLSFQRSYERGRVRAGLRAVSMIKTMADKWMLNPQVAVEPRDWAFTRPRSPSWTVGTRAWNARRRAIASKPASQASRGRELDFRGMEDGKSDNEGYSGNFKL